ncbi:MAG: Lrp/AsnC family transcriptional regulator [Deltaproteobacteria bacterium]|nr:Lrp/AsnC family transcriptional regulator [Deltaproteobacteria bacterium]
MAKKRTEARTETPTAATAAGPDPLLALLQQDGLTHPEQLAKALDTSAADVRDRMRRLEQDGAILGYRAIVDDQKLGDERVKAVIEVKMTPEREGGFDRVARRIAEFDEVHAVYLMSGRYDLLLFVDGRTLREVAFFVAERLAPLEGVTSTSTHFILRPYKQHGLLVHQRGATERLPVTP